MFVFVFKTFFPLISLFVSITSDISKNIETIKKFQQNKKMKATALAVRATMVFKTGGGSSANLKQKILNAAKLKRLPSLQTKRQEGQEGDQVTVLDEGEYGGGDEHLSKAGTQTLWEEDASIAVPAVDGAGS